MTSTMESPTDSATRPHSKSDSSIESVPSEVASPPAVLHPPKWLGGLGEKAKEDFDLAWQIVMADWPSQATQKEKRELYDEMHGNVLEGSDDAYERKVKRSGLNYEQYDSLAEAFIGIAKQHPNKQAMEESSLEKYKRIKAEMEEGKEKRAAKRIKKEIKEGKQKVLTSYFRDPDKKEDLENDDWYASRSKYNRTGRSSRH